MRVLVGSLLWISGSTRPDLATVTSLPIQHASNPSPGHLWAEKYAIKYLKGTKDRGITFLSKKTPTFLLIYTSPSTPPYYFPSPLQIGNYKTKASRIIIILKNYYSSPLVRYLASLSTTTAPYIGFPNNIKLQRKFWPKPKSTQPTSVSTHCFAYNIFLTIWTAKSIYPIFWSDTTLQRQ